MAVWRSSLGLGSLANVVASAKNKKSVSMMKIHCEFSSDLLFPHPSLFRPFFVLILQFFLAPFFLQLFTSVVITPLVLRRIEIKILCYYVAHKLEGRERRSTMLDAHLMGRNRNCVFNFLLLLLTFFLFMSGNKTRINFFFFSFIVTTHFERPLLPESCRSSPFGGGWMEIKPKIHTIISYMTTNGGVVFSPARINNAQHHIRE